jgi:phenylalanyl-tRNA synthetase beta chain
LPDQESLPLANPISSELSRMRLSLWPGLVQVLRRNLSRRQGRVRIFEHGLRFLLEGNELKQPGTISGLIAGNRFPEQWGTASGGVDYFDAKCDVEALLALTAAEFQFEQAVHPALHPAQSARILRAGNVAGWVGALHPRLVRALDLERVPVVWELDEAISFAAELPVFREISRFPAIRRDLAVVVDAGVAVHSLLESVRATAGANLTESKVFDVYRGDRIDSGLKSVALGLILQDSSRTLTDVEADRVVAEVMARLESEFRARMRD